MKRFSQVERDLRGRTGPDSLRGSMIRGRFAFEVVGERQTRVLFSAASEWHLFYQLRDLAKQRRQLAWFESYSAPLTPRSLVALNFYLRSGSMLKWKSRRWDGGRELIGEAEWRRFCRMLDLRFDGRNTRVAA